MKTYARIYNGLVAEIIEPATYTADVVVGDQVIHAQGDEVAIEDRFTPDFVAALVDITDVVPEPKQGWTYDGNAFAAYVAPALTSAQILAANTATRNALLLNAGNAIAPLQDAVDLGMATAADTSMLTAWKTYRVTVNRVDLTQLSPPWPTVPDPSSYATATTHAIPTA